VNTIAIIKADYAILKFEKNPENSYMILKDLVENEEQLSLKATFIVKVAYEQCKFLLSISDLDSLCDVITSGEKNGLYYNSKTAKLQLAICYAIKGDMVAVSKILNETVDIRDFPKLTLGVYYNLCALVSIFQKEYLLAEEHLNKQEKCFSQFGKSYSNKIQNNKKLIAMRVSKYNIEHSYYSPDLKYTFYIETRF